MPCSSSSRFSLTPSLTVRGTVNPSPPKIGGGGAELLVCALTKQAKGQEMKLRHRQSSGSVEQSDSCLSARRPEEL